MHRVIKLCASEDEIDLLAKQEDCGIVDYHLRFEYWKEQLQNNPQVKEKAEKILSEDKRHNPL